MAKHEILQGWNIGAAKVTVPIQGKNGQPSMEERWDLRFIENGTGNLISFLMDKDTRDHVVRQLTSGVVLAGGDFPKL